MSVRWKPVASSLRQLLIQRAARLQDRPALTAPAWGTLSWTAWRNRVEGVALGLLARPLPPGTPIHVPGPGPWAWAAEVAAACAGLVWLEGAGGVPASVLGGADFNAEEGRGPYHDREREVLPETQFTPGLSHQALLHRLQSWNRRLGWDHSTEVDLAEGQAGTVEGRAALWCALYAGAHVRLRPTDPPQPGRWSWRTPSPASNLDLEPFQTFFSE